MLHLLLTTPAKVQITLNIIITVPQDTAAGAGFGYRTAQATAAALCLKIIQLAMGTNSPQLQLHFPSVWTKKNSFILSETVLEYWVCGLSLMLSTEH